MTASTQELAAELDELIRRIPGVGALYRSGSLLSRAVAAGREALNSAGETAPYVRLSETGTTPTVNVSIGVDGDSAVETCRSVHDAISARLREHGYPDATIMVTVAHVVG